MEIGEIVTWKM